MVTEAELAEIETKAKRLLAVRVPEAQWEWNALLALVAEVKRLRGETARLSELATEAITHQAPPPMVVVDPGLKDSLVVSALKEIERLRGLLLADVARQHSETITEHEAELIGAPYGFTGREIVAERIRLGLPMTKT